MLGSLQALLVKNASLKRRRWLASTLELALPVLLFCGLLYMRNNTLGLMGEYSDGEEKEPYFFLNMDALEHVGLAIRCSDPTIFYLAPDKSELTDFTKELAIRLNGTALKLCEMFTGDNPTVFEVLKDAHSLENTLLSAASDEALDLDEVRVLGGAVITENDDNDLSYVLRFAYYNNYQLQMMDTGIVYEKNPSFFSTVDGLGYYLELGFQLLIDLHFVQMRLGAESEALIPWNNTDFHDHEVEMTLSSKKLPVYSLISSSVAALVSTLLLMATSAAFIPLIPIYLKGVVVEKNAGVKEFLKMHGVSLTTYWFSWFLTSFISVLISSAIITLLLRIDILGYAIIERSSVIVIFVSFLLYSVNFLSCNFFISSLVSSPNFSLSLGLVYHLVSFYCPYIILDEDFTSIPVWLQAVFYVLAPNVSIWRVIVGMFNLESEGVGMDLADISKPLTDLDDSFTLGMVWAIMIGSSLLFWTIMMYIDNVKPGPFGVAKPLYFFLMPSYYCVRGSSSTSEVEEEEGGEAEGVLFEKEPSGLKRGVEVRNLRKIFYSFMSNSTVHAVSGASFSSFEGEIMALLGHNGAGKTTTMSILSGLISQSDGIAKINTLDVKNNMSAVRKVLGLCPQHNMLFAYLTVKEHLIVFGMLRGLSWSEANKDAERVAQDVALGHKLDTPSTALSGGMKRKLHLGIALIGQSRVLLLDEPTSGLDPEARREIWDVLQRVKSERTIVLTTHFMEEADALGDRIAIMADGKVRCYGTSLFLKKALGSGYRLTISTNRNCSLSALKSFVRDTIPSTTVLSRSLDQVTLNLPMSEESKFATLLKRLASSKTELDIGGFGLAVTSLEDVFLKVGAQEFDIEAMANQERDNMNGSSEQQRDQSNLMRALSNDEADHTEYDEMPKTVAGVQLGLMQLKALIIKRVLETFSSWKLLLIMTVVTLLLSVSTVFSSNDLLGPPDDVYQPPLRWMSLDDYDNPQCLIGPLDGVDEPVMGAIISTLLKEANEQAVIREVDNITTTTLDETADLDLAEAGQSIIVGVETTNSTAFIKDVVSIKMHYNAVPLHSAPMAVNLGTNALFRLMLADPKVSIKTAYHPINAIDSVLSRFRNREVNGISTSILYPIFLNLSLFIFLSVFMNYPLRERKANAKQVQIMAGVHPALYWLGFFLWDFLLYLLLCLVIVASFIVIDTNALFITNLGLVYLVTLMSFFGAGLLLRIYGYTFIVGSIPAAYTLLIMELAFLGIVAPVVFITLMLIFTDTNFVFSFALFSFTPFNPMGRGLSKLIEILSFNAMCVSVVAPETLTDLCQSALDNPASLSSEGVKTMSQCCYKDYVPDEVAICGQNFTLANGDVVSSLDCHEVKEVLSFDMHNGISVELLLLVLNVLIQALFVAGLETGVLQRAYKRVKNAICSRGKLQLLLRDALDEDVMKEQRLTKNLIEGRGNVERENEHALVVSGLTKSFGRFLAVDQLCFTVRSGECFGLLGVNGAGKTTSFRMLTGDEYPDNGEAVLNGYSRSRQKRKFLSNVGYCPQFDAIINELTGRQLITLMANIRGVAGSHTKEQVNKWISFVGLEKYADKACGTYSGGNKRKLNVAQALVGDPAVILMDEPSTGVDPGARRRLWQTVLSIKKRGQAVVLTSHSMDECENLCDRLGIMVNGQFKCMGAPQHLKNRFGMGFTVAFHIGNKTHFDEDENEGEQQRRRKSKKERKRNSLVNKESNNEDSNESVEQIVAFMNHAFEDKCVLREQRKGLVSFHIGDPRLPWHVLLEKLQEAKRTLPIIQDYALGETTLEEIFLHFAGNQRYQ